MIVHNVVQGSEEWHRLRLGIPTASCFDKIVTPKKLGLAEKASVTYLHTLLAEWIFDAPLETFEGGWMTRGKDLEKDAIAAYEFECDVDSLAIGFATTDDGMAGASPDRLVGEDGTYESKCPALQTHVGYLLDPTSLVEDYKMQIQGQLWVTDRDWCDIHSFFPGMPSVIMRVPTDTKVSLALSTHIPAFVETMLQCREKLTQAYGELRRPRVTEAQKVAVSNDAFDAFMRGVV